MKKQIIAFSLALTSLFTFNASSYFCNDVSALTIIAQIKDISLDKDVIKVGETTHINAEWDTGSTFQATCFTSDSSIVKVVSGSADNGWDIEGISEGDATINVNNNLYSKSINITVEADSENFDWLPKAVDEYEKFIAKNGTVSTHGKYLVYCDKINYSAGVKVIMEQTGSAEIKEIKKYSIDETEEPIPPGSPSNAVYVYEAVSAGNVRITISQGIPWHLELSKEIKSSENYKVDENLNITKVTENNSVSGDINADGLFNVTDVVTLQKWFLNVSDVKLADWKTADLCEDNILNVFDLCAIKQKLISEETLTKKVYVENTEELKNALESAKAGDEIILAEGEYVYSGATPKGYMFTGSADGTEENPIIIRSDNPEKPAIISGSTTSSKIALTILGDWWEIRDLKVTNAQKGIMLDNSNHTKIMNCEVYNIGSEGIHFRDNSSYCLAESCYVHDTGVVSPGYGEAVYVGSAKSTTGYGYECHYNTIRNCKLGPNVAAEHVDIKEYTIGTTVENCTFDGTGMSGANSAKSFINIKGNDCVIINNVGYRNGCTAIQRAFEQNNVVENWGQNAMVYGNKVYMDTATNTLGKKMYFLNAWNCSATVWDNFMAYDGELFSVDNEDDHWYYYNCNLLTYGNN